MRADPEYERSDRLFWITFGVVAVLLGGGFMWFLDRSAREHARQSIECVKAGGDWRFGDCRQGKR